MSKIYNISTSIHQVKDIISNIRDENTKKSLTGILNLVSIRNTKTARYNSLDAMTKFTHMVYNSKTITNFIKMELLAHVIDIVAEYGDNKYDA